VGFGVRFVLKKGLQLIMETFQLNLRVLRYSAYDLLIHNDIYMDYFHFFSRNHVKSSAKYLQYVKDAHRQRKAM
jgi:hypothetical protein